MSGRLILLCGLAGAGTARVAERNRALPEGAPRVEPALVAFWNGRMERPDADELALFDSPGEP